MKLSDYITELELILVFSGNLDIYEFEDHYEYGEYEATGLYLKLDKPSIQYVSEDDPTNWNSNSNYIQNSKQVLIL